MRTGILLLVCGLAGAQTPDPAHEPLNHAYEALQNKLYDEAVEFFLKAIELAPERSAIRKDLAYTYLKIGENLPAREQFREAMRLEPEDFHVALEYAFLCYETKEQAQARRVFDRVRKAGDPESRATAEKAFQSIDRPLAEGIARWKEAIRLGSDNFSVHYELATLAEQRDELELAAEHYQKAWHLLPDRRSVLVDLGRVWKALNKMDAANAALLAASRGDEPRTAEAALELLPRHYPYVSEFRGALELDPANLDLRRELAFLLLRMGNLAEGELEFKIITSQSETDYLSAAQLGFLYMARGDKAAAMPLFERVLHGGDEELANRVRAVLHEPQTLQNRATPPPAASVEAKLMAERSLKAGYIRDALKYLQIAQEDDPADFGVMLRLGWTYNMLHKDAEAVHWFELARRSPDPGIAQEAGQAYRNLWPQFERFRISVWTFPLYSRRWHDLFSYAQVKTELRIAFPVHPYLSLRFIGDVRGTTGPPPGAGITPQYLSENAMIPGIGLATKVWHGLVAWGEAGWAYGYLSHHMLPDYRGGVSFTHGFGHLLQSKERGFFLETNDDGIFVSRFGNDFLVYSQNRVGYTPALGPLQMQWYWNVNITMDQKRQAWANFFESGPGVRFRFPWMPPSLYFTANYLRGNYTLQGAPGGPTFTDIRVGFWYAFSY